MLSQLGEVVDTFAQVSPNRDSWLQAGAGKSGITYLCAATKNGVRAEVVISTSDKETNKRVFKQLHNNKALIESKYGGSLSWQELPDYKLSIISKAKTGLSIFNESDWPEMISFFKTNIPKLVHAFKDEIENVKTN